MAKRGISLLDLATPSSVSQAVIPDELAKRLENLSVTSHRSTSSPGAIIHSGVIQPISEDFGFPSLRNWPVEVPGLNAGLPFRLVRTRATQGSGQTLEPAGTNSFVDLVVDRIAITVPGLRPAVKVASSAAEVGHLLPDVTRSAVKIVGAGVLRIDLSGTGDVVRFVDWPDPFDPAAPSGAVGQVTFEPSSFFFGSSEIGMTVERLIWDASAEVTPPEIIARGQTPGWQGISIAEASLYLPPNTPAVDKVKVSVKDVLLGSPAGLQGEIQVELGRTPINAAAVQFLQDFAGTDQPLTVDGSGREVKVPFVASTPGTARVRGTFDPAILSTSNHPRMLWQLPEGTFVDSNDTGWFITSVGEKMSGRFSEQVDGTEVFDAPTTYEFVQSESTVKYPTKVTVHTGGADIANVVSVSGSSAALNLLGFESALNPADAAKLMWKHGEGADAHTRTGPDFVLISATEPGTSYTVVTDTDNRRRRIRVDVLAQGDLLIGAADGVHDKTGALVAVRGVAGTYNLNAFHADGSLKPSTPVATASAGVATVPDGGLAEVTVGIGKGPDAQAPAASVTEEEVRHVEIRFPYSEANPSTLVTFLPGSVDDPLGTRVAAWAALFTAQTRFIVIGRCCDISSAGFNKDLATNRANAVAAWLPSAQTKARGEQDPPGAMAADEDLVTPALSGDEKGAAWLITKVYTDQVRDAWGLPKVATLGVREEYRRADIYAVDGAYTGAAAGDTAAHQPTDTQELDQALRRAYLPGADVAQVPALEPSGPRLPWLVRLRVRWDSPTVVGWADAIPTEAEFTLEWATTPPKQIPAPGGGTNDLVVRSPSTPPSTVPSTETYTLTGKWAYDSRSGQTVFSLSIASSGDPKGLAAIDSNFLAIALALAPALLAGIGAAGIDGAAVRVAALGLASGVLASVAKDGEVVIHSAEVEHRERSLGDLTGSRTRVLLDYTAAVGLDIDAAGLGHFGTGDGHPLKVRYKHVGLEFDDAKTEWYEKFGLVFDDVSFEIADIGRWQIDGPLGQLLQVAATRAGVGSSWFECDLEFALDLGVVSINGATVRCNFADSGFSAELRGLALGVNIPGVLIGEGRVVLGDGGAFKAALELDLVSVGAKAMGDLSFDPAFDFLSIGLGLILPVGIPLGATGLAIFGFLGRFVSNGARALPSGHMDDPVGREIAWYRDVHPEDKFAPQRGEWAIGLGMIVGTLPDQAFTFNATGMLVVAFPDPAVVFGIDAKLVKKPAVTPTQQGTSEGASLELLGLIVVDTEAVMVGIRGQYTIPKVLDLKVPIDGYFPLPPAPPGTRKDAFVRIGSDGVVSEHRGGDPVTIKLLPGTLDMSAFSYLMIEEKQLHRLGDNPDFNFDGFSVGFGAGFSIKWAAGPIKLEATAKLLVGFGTNPFLLKGGIFVKGELSLVVVKVSARGDIVVTVWDDHGVKVNLKGEFCGSVSFFFFSIEGCVGIEIGDSLAVAPPMPQPPIGKVSLTDRRGFTTALPTAAAPTTDQTVWPDTVPVIEFTHHVVVDLATSAFTPGGGPAGPLWSGTSELKYAYRITGVEIVPDGSSALAGPLDSGWWLPTNRPGVLSDGDVAVSESEGVFLALLAWDPAPWTYWLTDGGAGTDGDPATTPGRLCDPPTRPERACVLGKGGTRSGPDAVDFRPEYLGSPPFPSRFTFRARERAFGLPLTGVTPFLYTLGWGLTPGAVGPGPFGTDVWWLAAVTDHSFTTRTTELRGVCGPAIIDGELLLVVCTDFRKRPTSTGVRTCEVVGDHFGPDEDLGTDNALGSVKIESQSTDLRTFAGANGAATTLRFPGDGITFHLPAPSGQVAVTVQAFGSPLRLQAFDDQRQLIDTATIGQDPGPVEVALTGAGITRVDLTGGGGYEVGVLRVCWGTAPSVPGEPEDTMTGQYPVVMGSAAAGGDQEWTPKVEQQIRTKSGTCSLVRYIAPDAANTWSGVRIREWAGTGRHDAGRVGLVQLCGVSAHADALATANADYATFLKDLINTRADTQGGAVDPQPARRDLLKANQGYTINVTWEWQGWVKTDAQPEPPDPPSSTGWQTGTTESYRFKTAATAVTAGSPPAELTQETGFDPRSMLRYLIAFEPDKGSAPHLLDDTLLVHLAVDHLDQLAGLYGRSVGLRLRRTDPPPGTLEAQPHPDDEIITVEWGKLFDQYRPEGQRRFLDAVRVASCLDEPNLGGTTGQVTADLIPGAWYDLTLMATPTADPNAETVVVSRSHFQASRYRNESELLAALGFGTPGPEAYIAPDAFLTAPVAAGALSVSDHDLDAALAGSGLDPWPLASHARTSALWLNDAGTWKVAGLLLEAPEAIVRTGRTALDIDSCRYAGVPLTQRVRNEAGTRVVLTPATPAPAPGAGTLSLTLRRTETDRTGQTTSTTVIGSRYALDEPRSARMEAGT